MHEHYDNVSGRRPGEALKKVSVGIESDGTYTGKHKSPMAHGREAASHKSTSMPSGDAGSVVRCTPKSFVKGAV